MNDFRCAAVVRDEIRDCYSKEPDSYCVATYGPRLQAQLDEMQVELTLDVSPVDGEGGK